LSSAIFYGLALLAFVIATELVGFIAIEVIVIAVGFFISASVLAAGALVRAAIRKHGEPKATAAATDAASGAAAAAGPIA